MLSLLPPEEQPEPEEAFAAAVAGQPDSKSPAAAQRLHRPPGGSGRARGVSRVGYLNPKGRLVGREAELSGASGSLFKR